MAGQDDDERRYDSLNEAFQDKGTSFENQQFLRRILGRLDVEGYYRYSDHFRAARSDGGPWLEVHYGSTNGFRSREEVIGAVCAQVA